MFWNRVEQIINSISAITTNGRGWLFEKLLSIEIKLSKFSPIRSGSYIALPAKYQSEQSLLSIRNYQDPNCFLYCYTAAFHLFYGPPLVNKDTTWRKKRSPSLYGPNNPRAHQSYGAHKMPMPVYEIEIFENKNKQCPNQRFSVSEALLKLVHELETLSTSATLIFFAPKKHLFFIFLDLTRRRTQTISSFQEVGA